MKKRRFLSILLVFLLLAATFVTGCSSNGSETASDATPAESDTSDATDVADVAEISGEVTIWHTYSDAETEVFENEVIPMFEEQYPNIDIVPTRMPYDGLKQQVIAGVSGDAAPDLMRMDIIWVPEFAKLGALDDVTTYDGFEEIKASVFEGPMQTNSYAGSYYGLPLNTNTKIAIYNKSLLAELGLSEPPKTMDELLDVAKLLKDKDDKWGIAIGGSGTWGMLPYFWTMGGSVTDDDFTVASGYLNSQASVAALETIASWYEDGLVGPSVIGEQPDTWGGMESASYFMMDDGPWYFSIVGDTAVENTVNTVLPEGPGGSVSVVGGEDLVMFKTSKNKDAAWVFMKWMLTDEPQIKMASVGLVPTVQTAAESEETLKSPYIANYIEQLKTAKPRTPSPGWEKMSETIGVAFESVIRGEKTATDALDEAAQLCDQFLAE